VAALFKCEPKRVLFQTPSDTFVLVSHS
jgi:hypothetical protein